MYNVNNKKAQITKDSKTKGKTLNGSNNSSHLEHLKKPLGNSTYFPSEKKYYDSVYQCDLCDNIFPTSKRLLIHKNRKNSHKYNCAYCPKVFVFRKHRVVHCQQAHTVLKSADLSYNDEVKPLSSTNLLKKSKNVCEFNFICKTCGERFINESEFTRHSRKHTGVKPFSCTLCDKRFTQESNLNRHINVHMNNPVPFFRHTNLTPKTLHPYKPLPEPKSYFYDGTNETAAYEDETENAFSSALANVNMTMHFY